MVSKTLSGILEKILIFLILFTLFYSYFLYKNNQENYKKNIKIDNKILVQKAKPSILEGVDFLRKLETLFVGVQLEDFQFSENSITLAFKGEEHDLKKFWNNILVEEDFWVISAFYMSNNYLRLTFKQDHNDKILDNIKWNKTWFGKKNNVWKFNQLNLVTVFVDNGEQIAVLRYPSQDLVTVKKGDKIHDCRVTELDFQKIKCQDERKLERGIR